MNAMLTAAGFLAHLRDGFACCAGGAILGSVGDCDGEHMTGKELREIRLKMGIPVVEFGLLVLKDTRGNLNTVRKWVRRMEKLDTVVGKVFELTTAYYENWKKHGHDDDAMDAAYEKAKAGRKRRGPRRQSTAAEVAQ